MNTDKKSEQILEGPLWKIMLIISLPIVMTNFIDGMYGIIDSLFIASVGSKEVAVVTFVSPIEDTFNAIGTGLSIAGASILAKYIGMKDIKKMGTVVKQLILLGLFLGLGVAVGGNLLSSVILDAASVTPEMFDMASAYFKVTILSVPCWFMTLIYLAIKRAQGNTKETLKINILMLVVKMLLSFIFIFVLDLGIMGVAYATVTAKLSCALMAIKELFFTEKNKEMIQSAWKLDFRMLGHIGWVALPLILEKSLVSFGFVTINKYVLAYGEPVLAAYGITNKVNSVLFKATAAFGTGLAVIVAQNLGANNKERVKEATNKMLLLAMSFATIFVSMLIPARTVIAGIFTEGASDPTYQHIIDAMGVYTLAVIPWAVTEVMLGVYQGTGKTTYNLMVSLMRIYVFRIPVIMLLMIPALGLEEYSIWYAMLISNILSALFAYIVYVVRKEKLFANQLVTNDSNSMEKEVETAI